MRFSRCKAARPAPIVLTVGASYRNGAGQVREILWMDADAVKFLVTEASLYRGRATTQHPQGYTGIMSRRSFQQWAVIKVT